jgi:hypothetical protein
MHSARQSRNEHVTITRSNIPRNGLGFYADRLLGVNAATIDCMDCLVGLISSIAPMFAFTDGDRWRPGIGDPTFIGWFTVIAYFGAAYLCWRASRAGLQGQKVRWFWNGLAILLILLGINKQLDLQTELTFIGRDFAKATGWYDDRRVVQVIFVFLIGIAGMLATAALFWIYRAELKRLGGALAGVGFLITFIVIRAASFHHVDRFLLSTIGGMRMNWIFELGGIAAIASPAWRAIKRKAAASFVWVSGGGAQGPIPTIAGPGRKK